MLAIPLCLITLYNENHHKSEITERFEELKFLKFERCCISTIRQGLHLLLKQSILKVFALFQMLCHVLFLAMTSTVLHLDLFYFFLLKRDLFNQLKKHCELKRLLFKSLTLLSSIYNQSSSGMFDS